MRGQATPVDFSPQSLQRLQGVNPLLQQLMMETERRAEQAGVNIEVTEGMRDRARQAELVSQGASQTMNSRHLAGNAVDIHVTNPDGSANWDFDAYGPVADIAKTVASEMGIPDFVWGGDWASLRDGVHFQVGGPSAPSTETSGGGLMAQAPQQQQGLLGRMSTSGTSQQVREPSIWDALEGKPIIGGLADPDTRARLAIALQGMTIDPNEGMIDMLQGDMDGRREEERVNQTVQWLQSIGRTDLAEAVAAGSLMGGDAAAIALQPPAPRDVVEVNGQLVDRATGEVVGDYRTQGGDATSAMQNYEYMIANGVAPETAIERAFGGGGTTVNVGGEGEVGTIPPGYELFQDPATGARSMRPIPGGPVAAEVAGAAVAAGVAEGRRDTSTNVIVSAAAAAREAANARVLGGALGGLAAMNPSSNNAELYRQVDVLKSNATVGNLQAMRDASPTGGAMGALSDREGAMLADQAGALDPASPNFLRDLDAYERTLLRTVHGPEAGERVYQETRQQTTGAPVPAAAAGGTDFSTMGANDIAAMLPSLTGPDREAALARLRQIAGQ